MESRPQNPENFPVIPGLNPYKLLKIKYLAE